MLFLSKGPVERPDSHQKATFPASDFVDIAPVARGHGGGGGGGWGVSWLIKGNWAVEGERGAGRTEKRESAALPMSCTLFFFSSSARRFPVGCVSLG